MDTCVVVASNNAVILRAACLWVAGGRVCVMISLSLSLSLSLDVREHFFPNPDALSQTPYNPLLHKPITKSASFQHIM